MRSKLKILCGDVLDKLSKLPSDSIHCCVTSPPYWAQRDYNLPGQLGLEKTPQEYIAKMLSVFAEVKRVLHPSGTLWLNIGDKQIDKDLCLIPERLIIALQDQGWYIRSKIAWCKRAPMPESVTDRPTSAWEPIFLLTKSAHYFYDGEPVKQPYSDATLPEIGEDYRGQDTKDFPSHKGQSASDSKRRIIESLKRNGGANLRNFWLLGPQAFKGAHFATFPTEIPRRAILAGTSAKGCCPQCLQPWRRIIKSKKGQPESYRGSRFDKGKTKEAREFLRPVSHCERTISIQTIGWQPDCECGQAPIPCIVLDPFAGSGTTGQVALELGRNAILIELNPKYIDLIKTRCNNPKPR